MRIATILLLLVVSSISVWSQAGTSVAVGTITGRVTSNGKAVSGCLVSIWKQPFNSPDGVGSLTAKTDPEGKYRLRLPAGSYYASANNNGFFETENGAVAQQLRSVTVLP